MIIEREKGEVGRERWEVWSGGGGGSVLFDGSVWDRSWLRGDARGTTAKMREMWADAIGPAMKFGGTKRGGLCWFGEVGSCSSKRVRVA